MVHIPFHGRFQASKLISLSAELRRDAKNQDRASLSWHQRPTHKIWPQMPSPDNLLILPPLFTLLDHWPSCCFSNITSTFTPQGLGTCCSLFGMLFSGNVHNLLCHFIQVSAQLLQRGLPWAFSLRHPTHSHPPSLLFLALLYFFSKGLNPYLIINDRYLNLFV